MLRVENDCVLKGVATMTVSVNMSSRLQSADKAKAAMDKAKAAIDKTIRDGADRLKTMSAGDLSGFISRLPAQDRGFVERTAGAFRKMSPAQLDQVVAFMGADQKRRLAAAFAKLPQSVEKTSDIPSGVQQSAGPAVIIKRASSTALGGLVYGKLKT
jgi:hypothetical protein